MFNVEQHMIFSRAGRRNFQLSVTVPDGYESSDRRHPVVYVLDGDVLAGMVASLTTPAQWAWEVPELIVVSIGYGVDNYDQWVETKGVDFSLPDITSHDSAGSAGSSPPQLFLQALADDIVPFVDQAYRTTPDDRCLYGVSQAGFFVLYALFNRPELFQRYLSGSGVWQPQSSYLCETAQHVFDRYEGRSIQLYLSLGELESEPMAAFREFTNILTDLQDPHLDLTVEVYPNVGHDPELIALTYLHGLRNVYGRQSATDSADEAATE
jgi:predicted alpha/beta superfamily hydrolase